MFCNTGGHRWWVLMRQTIRYMIIFYLYTFFFHCVQQLKKNIVKNSYFKIRVFPYYVCLNTNFSKLLMA